ncbi:DUF2521 family protein [Lederbergia citrea]|uniref:DUF2521 family protein n=1 Tax=Lederbergia citrea TaxID=2833581 RepID=A0A942UW70_9BACI|nr:DUF2521 family protein [Lederbergia citrea]MBS4179617.1 DUF2521 family protein [Lederbergia citrea]MBS4206284.1 DUF2521 family protein [Lederbergia citrea]MBS4225004.1 DUF2521 family protein [Lederbergia citrea]
MIVVTTFEEKKREKQLTYERKLLRELSMVELKKSVLLHFAAARKSLNPWLDEGVEEACFDVAIEAFLTGGEFSRFTVHGETMEMAKRRCRSEIKHFTDTLYHFWLYWDYGKETIRDESIYFSCEHFVDSWWKEGYIKGERRHKLRLH